MSVAASMLAHASLADPYGGDERWSNAIAAADVVEKCDDATPPEECRGVMVAHAKNMAEMELWSLSREAAYLALAAKGSADEPPERRGTWRARLRRRWTPRRTRRSWRGYSDRSGETSFEARRKTERAKENSSHIRR